MSASPTPTPGDGPRPDRRRYESAVRKEQVAATRERIVRSGAALAHDLPGWDWRGVTYAAVAQRAGVSTRTVYRYFAAERDLRDAIMGRLQEEAGVALDDLTLDDVAEVTARVFGYLGSFTPPARPPADPTFAALDARRRDALFAAVAAAASDWSERDREAAAGAIDVLWGVPSYERLREAWGLGADDASSALTWVIGLVEDAIREGRRPPISG